MTHALIPLGHAPMPFHADAIFFAIDAHNEAWSAFQVALPGQASRDADQALSEALDALLGTACATRPGAFCLLRHLRWFLIEEASNADGYGTSWPVARAREADLTLLLGCDGIERIAPALPSGRLPAAILALPAPAHLPAPQPTPVHYGRFLAIGEAIGALVLIAGGCLITGIATLV